MLSCRYEHLAKSAPTILDDSLSADAYLNVLYMPSTFPRSERSRRSQEAPDSHSMLSSSDFEHGPRSNLDNVRYVECVNYLQEVSCKLFLFSQRFTSSVCILIHGIFYETMPVCILIHGIINSPASSISFNGIFSDIDIY